MRFGTPLALGALGALALTSCASTIEFTPAGSGLKLEGRSGDCTVEFFRSKKPEQAYDELGALHAEGKAGMSGPARPKELMELMRRKACSLGADAVIVTRDYVPSGSGSSSTMTGTAIKYRAGEAAAPSEAPAAPKPETAPAPKSEAKPEPPPPPDDGVLTL
jgi:hypothetical protein